MHLNYLLLPFPVMALFDRGLEITVGGWLMFVGVAENWAWHHDTCRICHVASSRESKNEM